MSYLGTLLCVLSAIFTNSGWTILCVQLKTVRIQTIKAFETVFFNLNNSILYMIFSPFSACFLYHLRYNNCIVYTTMFLILAYALSAYLHLTYIITSKRKGYPCNHLLGYPPQIYYNFSTSLTEY